MEKKFCTHVVRELSDLIGEDAANDVICGFLRATDAELLEIRRLLEPLVQRDPIPAG